MIKCSNTFAIMLISGILLTTAACGTTRASSQPVSETKISAETSVSQAGETDPEKLYSEAMDCISSGKTIEGMKKLAEIPSYKDSEEYLYGYSYLEYYLGEWEADLGSDFKKGTTIIPYEMKFTVSDHGLWLDSEVNGYHRLRFPVTVDYTIWKDSKTQSGSKEYEGYALFYMNGGDEDERSVIIFGLETGGIWYNFEMDTDNTAICHFSASDQNGNVDTDSNNRFNCNRVSERQNAGIVWDKSSNAYAYEDQAYSTVSDYSAGGSTSSHVAAGSTSSDPAIRKALDYLAYTAFSRQGLIEQLEYEGFTHSEAQNAVDSCNVDWEEQALLKALQYLDYSAFSYSGLIEQLEDGEEFTHTEAVYGADHCGADWNEQAVLKAEQYLEYSTFSRSDLVDQLVYEGFTRSQAEYGAGRVF